jgi:anaerobic ribonucleoside-triphosphate reductase activating protein
MSQDNEFETLNVAATCIGTRALGPGWRSVVWVQGCRLSCPGCIAPEWIPNRPANKIDPYELAQRLLSDPQVNGLTLSGGEPMLQARGLASLVKTARKIRPISVISFTGYRFEQLIANPPSADIFELLALIDVLIDGPYIKAMNDNNGLRGSSNQRFIHLTNKLVGYPFETNPRKMEFRVLNGDLLMVGVPPLNIVQSIDRMLEADGRDNYVRS